MCLTVVLPMGVSKLCLPLDRKEKALTQVLSWPQARISRTVTIGG